jgi:transposase
MEEFIAFDVHKHYTWATVETREGRVLKEGKIGHSPGALSGFLRCHCRPGGSVAVETVGNWYWVINEIEAAGFVPLLVNARKAKHMMDNGNKTDRLDNRGMNRLQRSGTLPTVWIPPAAVRDQRELPRTRMMLVHQRTLVKNRILGTFGKHGLGDTGFSDPFGKSGRRGLDAQRSALPPHAGQATACMFAELDCLEEQIDRLESLMRQVFVPTREHQLLQSLPGVGLVLAVVIATEIGDIRRFGRAAGLASYAGVVSRVCSSGGKTRLGPPRQDINHHLKWALLEAANGIVMNAGRHPDRHVTRLYRRLKATRGYQKAVGAVARHLAEATFWVLTKQQPYREPASSTGEQAR